MSHGLFVVMGVSGSGKSLIGSALARALGLQFVEGDEYHSTENVARMASGIPLTDADRLGWLRALGARLGQAKRTGSGLVMSCSALKRSYRDMLRAEANDVQLIYLRGPRALLAERLAGRRGHFMPPSLLDSQLAALQEPTADEGVWACNIGESPEAIVDALVTRASA